MSMRRRKIYPNFVYSRSLLNSSGATYGPASPCVPATYLVPSASATLS